MLEFLVLSKKKALIKGGITTMLNIFQTLIGIGKKWGWGTKEN